ncbi:hypothetical protein IDH70_13690 [Mixta calida]|nr:hypothetical protein IDH70_13690 [Mixta calida]
MKNCRGQTHPAAAAGMNCTALFILSKPEREDWRAPELNQPNNQAMKHYLKTVSYRHMRPDIKKTGKTSIFINLSYRLIKLIDGTRMGQRTFTFFYMHAG